MLAEIFFLLFIIIGAVHLLHIAFYLVGANIYDIQTFRSEKLLKWLRKKSSYQPRVTVLIPAYNEQKVIERCLRSVWDSSYQNVDIVVINDGSKDSTSQVVKRFISSVDTQASFSRIVRDGKGFKRVWERKLVPGQKSIMLVEQENGGKASALNHALNHYTNGELVMTLDADSVLHKHAIKNAVTYFLDPEVVGVAANVRIIEENSILGLLQRFEHILAYRSKKFYTITNCELIIGGVASTYRMSALQELGFYDTDTVTEDIGLSMKIAHSGNKQHRLVYAADVAAMTEGVTSFKALLNQRFRWKLGNLQNIIKYRSMLFSTDKKYSKSLSWYRAPMSIIGEILTLLEPFLLAYVAYLSFVYVNPTLFIGAYMMITLYVLLSIWPDEHMSLIGKIKASFYAPIVYFIFYIMNVVQLFSAIKCLAQSKKLMSPISHNNQWVSPIRTGQRQVQFS